MAQHAHLGHLLDILDTVLNEPPLTRGGHPEMNEDQRAAVDHLRDSTQAQLALLVLAWELKTDATESDEELVEELRTLCTTVEDHFGVDLRATAADNRSLLPTAFPSELLAREGDGQAA